MHKRSAVSIGGYSVSRRITPLSFSQFFRTTENFKAKFTHLLCIHVLCQSERTRLCSNNSKQEGHVILCAAPPSGLSRPWPWTTLVVPFCNGIRYVHQIFITKNIPEISCTCGRGIRFWISGVFVTMCYGTTFSLCECIHVVFPLYFYRRYTPTKNGKIALKGLMIQCIRMKLTLIKFYCSNLCSVHVWSL